MPAAAIAGGSILGGVLAGSGAKRAANAQAKSDAAAIAEQRRQFDTLLSLTAPQRNIGNQALATLGGIYGYSTDSPQEPDAGTNEFAQLARSNPQFFSQLISQGGGQFRLGGGNQIQIPPNPARQPVTIDHATGQVAPANYENFFASPDYKFRFQQGENAVQNSAAAGPAGLYSGNTLRALTDYGQGMGASEFNNWFQRQAQLAGIGGAATSQAGNAALQTGANVGNLLVNQGNARASGIAGQTNAMTGIISQLAGLYGSGAFGNDTKMSNDISLPGNRVLNDNPYPWMMSGVPA